MAREGKQFGQFDSPYKPINRKPAGMSRIDWRSLVKYMKAECIRKIKPSATVTFLEGGKKFVAVPFSN